MELTSLIMISRYKGWPKKLVGIAKNANDVGLFVPSLCLIEGTLSCLSFLAHDHVLGIGPPVSDVF